jgi:hypothetical protein
MFPLFLLMNEGVFMNVEGQDGAVSSRRQALGQASGWLAAAGLAVVAVAPTVAYADPLAADNDADDVVKRIAAQSAAVNEAARAKKAKEAPKEKGDGGKSLVGLAAAGGVVLTLPFFLPNLMRIGTKLTSGGEDDGYGKKR